MEKQFYQDLLDQISDGVYFVDRDRRITYWNSGAERITGYEAGDVSWGTAARRGSCATSMAAVSSCA